MEKDIKRLGELGMLRESERVTVSVPYHDNGFSRTYTCRVYMSHGLRMLLKVPPRGYSIDGVFVDGDDEPDIGVAIRRKMLREQGIFVGGSGEDVLYGKVMKDVPETPEALRAAVSDFVSAVAGAVPAVDRMVLDYLANGFNGDLRGYLKRR